MSSFPTPRAAATNSSESKHRRQIECARLNGDNSTLEKGWNSKIRESNVPRLPALGSRYTSSAAAAGGGGGGGGTATGSAGTGSTNSYGSAGGAYNGSIGYGSAGGYNGSIGYTSNGSLSARPHYNGGGGSTSRINGTEGRLYGTGHQGEGHEYLHSDPSQSPKKHIRTPNFGAAPQSARELEMAARRKRQLEEKRRLDDERINRYLDTKKNKGKNKQLLEKKQNTAATAIQSKWRQHKARAELNQKKQEKQAATAIQSKFRQFQAKKQVTKMREDKKKLENSKRRKQSGGFALHTSRRAAEKSPMNSPRSKDLLTQSVLAALDDEDEPLTMEEIQSLTKQFRMVDADNSGDIDRLEFAVFYNLVAKTRLSRHECDELFDALDADGSGVLSLSEFLKVYKILLSRDKLKHDPKEAERLRKINEKLAAKAKVISENRQERRRAKEKIEVDQMEMSARNRQTATKVKTSAKDAAEQRRLDEEKRLAQIQEDKEHEARLQEIASQRKEIELFIHKAEIKAQRLESSEKEGSTVEGENLLDEFTPEEIETLRKQFQKVDTDNSGFIDKDEFAVFYNRVSIEQVSHQEGVQLFHQLDVDGSGELTFEEFVSVYNLLQQRERFRKDPDAAERLRKMDAKLAEKAETIAQARKDQKQTKLEASVLRMQDNQHKKNLHNDVKEKRSTAAKTTSSSTPPDGPKPPATGTAKKSFVKKSSAVKKK